MKASHAVGAALIVLAAAAIALMLLRSPRGDADGWGTPALPADLPVARTLNLRHPADVALGEMLAAAGIRILDHLGPKTLTVLLPPHLPEDALPASVGTLAPQASRASLGSRPHSAACGMTPLSGYGYSSRFRRPSRPCTSFWPPPHPTA